MGTAQVIGTTRLKVQTGSNLYNATVFVSHDNINATWYPGYDRAPGDRHRRHPELCDAILVPVDVHGLVRLGSRLRRCGPIDRRSTAQSSPGPTATSTPPPTPLTVPHSGSPVDGRYNRGKRRNIAWVPIPERWSCRVSAKSLLLTTGGPGPSSPKLMSSRRSARHRRVGKPGQGQAGGADRAWPGRGQDAHQETEGQPADPDRDQRLQAEQEGREGVREGAGRMLSWSSKVSAARLGLGEHCWAVIVTAAAAKAFATASSKGTRPSRQAPTVRSPPTSFRQGSPYRAKGPTVRRRGLPNRGLPCGRPRPKDGDTIIVTGAVARGRSRERRTCGVPHACVNVQPSG